MYALSRVPSTQLALPKYLLLVVFSPALHFLDLLTLITHLMLCRNYLIPSNFIWALRFHLVPPFPSYTLDTMYPNATAYHRDTQRFHCPTQKPKPPLWFSHTHILPYTYINFPVSCCHVDPSCVTSALTSSLFTCSTSSHRTRISLPKGFLWLLEPVLPMPTAGKKCVGRPSREQPSTDNQWELRYKYPSSLALQVEKRVYVLCSFSEFPSRGKPWLPAVVTDLIMCPFLAASPSRFPTPLLVLPSFTSQMNCLYLNPCLRVCIWGNSNQDTAMLTLGPTVPVEQKGVTAEHSVALRKIFSLTDKTVCLALSKVLIREAVPAHFSHHFFQM